MRSSFSDWYRKDMYVGAVHPVGHERQEDKRERQDAREADSTASPVVSEEKPSAARTRQKRVIEGVPQQKSAHGGDRKGNEEHRSLEQTGSDLTAGRTIRKREDRPAQAGQHLAGEEAAGQTDTFSGDHILAFGLRARKMVTACAESANKAQARKCGSPER